MRRHYHGDFILKYAYGDVFLEEINGKGVGERLLQAAIQYIFSFQGMREIELCLNTNNDRAMKLYKKVGFEEKACLQHYIIE